MKGIKTVAVDWSKPGEKAPFSEVPGSEKIWPADLVLLATGFLGPELDVGEMLGVESQRPRGNWETFKAEHGTFATNVPRRLRRRRLPPRPIARRVGHQRRPRRRPRHRRVPDGHQHAARAGNHTRHVGGDVSAFSNCDDRGAQRYVDCYFAASPGTVARVGRARRVVVNEHAAFADEVGVEVGDHQVVGLLLAGWLDGRKRVPNP